MWFLLLVHPIYPNDRLEDALSLVSDRILWSILQEEMIEKDVVLNGAQVTSMVGIVSSVAGGELPRGTGISILMTAFGLTKEKAEEIMGESGRSFKKEKKE